MIQVARVLRSFGSAGAAPAVPQFTVVDNADGTGGTATIAGSTPGTNNSVYVAYFNGEIDPFTFMLAGTRVGDGTVEVASGPGYYLGYVVSEEIGGASSASTPVYFVLTDGGDSVAYQCLLAAQARIRELMLPDIAATSVVIKKIALDRCLTSGEPEPDEVQVPAIILSPLRERMRSKEGTNAQDDVGYRVLVTIVAADNQEPTYEANLPTYTKWRQSIARAFRNQRLPGVPTVVTCVVDPGDQLVPRAFRHNWHCSGLILRFVSRETRGFGT